MAEKEYQTETGLLMVAVAQKKHEMISDDSFQNYEAWTDFIAPLAKIPMRPRYNELTMFILPYKDALSHRRRVSLLNKRLHCIFPVIALSLWNPG